MSSTLQASRASAEIPVIDLRPAGAPGSAGRRSIAAQIAQASRATGFFYVVGHGIDEGLLQAQLDIACRFFDLPLADKLVVHVDKSPIMRGYEQLAAQVLDAGSLPDMKESLMLGRDLGPEHPLVQRGVPFEGRNPWPSGVEGFRAQMEAYTDAMIRLGQQLAALLSLSLDLPEDFLESAVDEPNCAVRLLRYPPQAADAGDRQLGAGAHTDWGLITILLQDDSGGLEVRTADGRWISAEPAAGSLVINLGDMVPRLTNGLYRSNEHRVVNRRSGRNRHSVATFFNPPFDHTFTCAPTCLTPGEAAPAPFSFGQHIQDMMQRTRAVPA